MGKVGAAVELVGRQAEDHADLSQKEVDRSCQRSENASKIGPPACFCLEAAQRGSMPMSFYWYFGVELGLCLTSCMS